MAEILDRLNEMNESGVITYSVYSELYDLASQLEERKVGKWIEKLLEGKMICSCCNKDNKHNEYMDFCPNCGADMRGNEE